MDSQQNLIFQYEDLFKMYDRLYPPEPLDANHPDPASAGQEAPSTKVKREASEDTISALGSEYEAAAQLDVSQVPSTSFIDHRGPDNSRNHADGFEFLIDSSSHHPRLEPTSGRLDGLNEPSEFELVESTGTETMTLSSSAPAEVMPRYWQDVMGPGKTTSFSNEAGTSNKRLSAILEDNETDESIFSNTGIMGDSNFSPLGGVSDSALGPANVPSKRMMSNGAKASRKKRRPKQLLGLNGD